MPPIKPRTFQEKPCDSCPRVFIPTSSKSKWCNECRQEQLKKYNTNYNKEYRDNNKEKQAKEARIWKQKNREQVLSYRSFYIELNKQELRAIAKEWREQNQHKIIEYKDKNRKTINEQARKRGTGHLKHRNTILEEQNYKCFFCGINLRIVPFHIHHVHRKANVETYAGHCIDDRENLVALCVPCHKKEHRNGFE